MYNLYIYIFLNEDYFVMKMLIKYRITNISLINITHNIQTFFRTEKLINLDKIFCLNGFHEPVYNSLTV